MRSWGTAVLAAMDILVVLITGCAKGTPTVFRNSTNVTVTFIGGTPLAVATQAGTGSFTLMTPGNTVTFPVTPGNTKYAIAYVCPPVSAGGTITSETVIQATTQDTAAFTVSCFGPPATGTATGSVTSAITGTANIKVFGSQGFSGNVTGASGSFSINMPTGTNDVAAVAFDSSNNVQGVHLVRSQTVPGVINNGSSIIVSPADATTTADLTVNNIPASFVSPPNASVAFITANSTTLLLTNNSVAGANPQPYHALPTAAIVSTDFYLYESNTSNTTTNQSVGITTTTTTGGGAFSVTLPAPWTFAGPAPAKFPTFTFVYSGFTGQPAIADQGSIQWSTGATTSNQITVLATANFQAGATTITIPDLTSLAGFLTPAATGTTINWVADIFGGTNQEFTFVPNPPPNSSVQFVQNRGTFMQP